jgi:cold shock CspA family protein
MSSSSVSISPVSSSVKFTGRVKWFNNKAGYGFVTITDGANSGKDVFVHHSSINVDSEQYKYLVQGEYIDFCLNDTNGVGDHEYQAGNVSGIGGGKLMCETRRDSRSTRTQYKNSVTEPVQMPRARAPPPSEEGDREWSYVSKARSPDSEPMQRSGAGRGSAGRGSAGRGSAGRSSTGRSSTGRGSTGRGRGQVRP